MSGETFYGLREMVLPGPSQTTGYRSILVIGTTGAGKSTLVRQIMGTDMTDAFPATSASKTTVAEAEILLAPGAFYAVATFMPLVEVRSYLEENVMNAALAVFDGRPASEVRSRLLDHIDQRFRLRYLLGDSAPLGEAAADLEGLIGDFRRSTDAILSQIHSLLEETVIGEFGTMIDAGIATSDTPDDELHILIKDRLAVHPTINEIIEFLTAEIKSRVEILCPTDVITSRDGWPLYWRCTRDNREEFLAELRRVNGNDHAMFGMLLTPLVNGVRVRGPFHPRWAREIPYVMLIDREGLGHTPDSVSSLPSSTTRMFDEVDTIIIVDNAQQPMQAAPVAAMRQIAAAGHGDKLILCFSHFEMVEGPNLPDLNARRNHVIASVDQVLSAIGAELGWATERLLRQQLDRNLYLLSRLHTELGTRDDTDTVAELRWLLGQLRIESEILDLGASRPIYSAEKLTYAVTDAIGAFLRYWELRLGISTDPAVKPAHWSKIKSLCVRYARRSNDEYEAMRPAGDLIAALTDALRSFSAQPDRWSAGLPDEDTEQEIHDALTRLVAADLRRLVSDRLFLDSAELWTEARDVAGDNSVERRASMVYHRILEPLVGTSDNAVPLGDHSDFAEAVSELIRTKAAELDIEYV